VLHQAAQDSINPYAQPTPPPEGTAIWRSPAPAKPQSLLEHSRRSFKRWTAAAVVGLLVAAVGQAGFWTAADGDSQRAWMVLTVFGLLAVGLAACTNAVTVFVVRSWRSYYYFNGHLGRVLSDVGRRHDYLTDTGAASSGGWPDRWLQPPWRIPAKSHKGPPAHWQVQPRPEIHTHPCRR
jgi:hypothetical protein